MSVSFSDVPLGGVCKTSNYSSKYALTWCFSAPLRFFYPNKTSEQEGGGGGGGMSTISLWAG